MTIKNIYCTGFTLKGRPCNNKIQKPGGYCYRHSKLAAVGVEKPTIVNDGEVVKQQCKGTTLKGQPCRLMLRAGGYCKHHDPESFDSSETEEGKQVFDYPTYIKIFKTYETRDFYQFINIPILHSIKDKYYFVGKVPPMADIPREVRWLTACRALRVYLTHKFDDLHKSEAVRLGRHKPTVSNIIPYVPPSPEEYVSWSAANDSGSISDFHRRYTNNPDSMDHIYYISTQYEGVLTNECIYLALAGDILLGWRANMPFPNRVLAQLIIFLEIFRGVDYKS